MTDDELIERLEHFSGLSYGNPICGLAAQRLRQLLLEELEDDTND